MPARGEMWSDCGGEACQWIYPDRFGGREARIERSFCSTEPALPKQVVGELGRIAQRSDRLLHKLKPLDRP
jgi:hypothetical protein